MVAAAKYAKAEPELKCVQAYGIGAQTFFDNIGGPLTDAEVGTATREASKKRLLILMTIDCGLCGAVHSSIAKVCGFI